MLVPTLPRPAYLRRKRLSSTEASKCCFDSPTRTLFLARSAHSVRARACLRAWDDGHLRRQCESCGPSAVLIVIPVARFLDLKRRQRSPYPPPTDPCGSRTSRGREHHRHFVTCSLRASEKMGFRAASSRPALCRSVFVLPTPCTFCLLYSKRADTHGPNVSRRLDSLTVHVTASLTSSSTYEAPLTSTPPHTLLPRAVSPSTSLSSRFSAPSSRRDIFMLPVLLPLPVHSSEGVNRYPQSLLRHPQHSISALTARVSIQSGASQVAAVPLLDLAAVDLDEAPHVPCPSLRVPATPPLLESCAALFPPRSPASRRACSPRHASDHLGVAIFSTETPLAHDSDDDDEHTRSRLDASTYLPVTTGMSALPSRCPAQCLRAIRDGADPETTPTLTL
ncbi:hypothetical protein C8R45DRAFT_1095846 [Mycena sanguinolenta]|nr:hypothetical protein C8R45DRAFT_1095846 [Mycena sanguinolenta]